jgi:hypothetical protein
MDFTFQVTLPGYLRVSPKRKHRKIISDTSSGREKADSDHEEKRIQNPNVNKSWICKANENYRDIFAVHSDHFPKEGGSPYACASLSEAFAYGAARAPIPWHPQLKRR